MLRTLILGPNLSSDRSGSQTYVYGAMVSVYLSSDTLYDFLGLYQRLSPLGLSSRILHHVLSTIYYTITVVRFSKTLSTHTCTEKLRVVHLLHNFSIYTRFRVGLIVL